MSDEIKKITWKDFFFETPLYEKIKFTNFEKNITDREIDWFSPLNHIDTTYSIQYSYLLTFGESWECSSYWRNVNGTIQRIILSCKRKNENINFYIFVWDDYIEKVWQAPSLADMQFAELWKKYNKVLERDDLKLFKKAIGLNAHGVWAGSFVYLRRIFEHLIYETFDKCQLELWIKEEEFKTKHMDEKVDILEKYLPEDLVKMRKIYSILSKWVHELEEDECLKYFPALKMLIELILDQKIDMDKKEKVARERQRMMESMLQELS